MKSVLGMLAMTAIAIYLLVAVAVPNVQNTVARALVGNSFLEVR